MEIRAERPEDNEAIARVTTAAFGGRHEEAAIVASLRRDGALTVSLVLLEDEAVIGHVAFSPVLIDGRACGWHGLGPVSVRPDRQRSGVGQALIIEGLARLRAKGAAGCVVLGDPAYYLRFGFANDPALRYADAPAFAFQRLVFVGTPPAGRVEYHASFGGH